MPLVTASVDWESGQAPEDLVRKLQRLERILLDEELPRAMGDIALAVEREAKERAPVDTGTLRASIESVVETIAAGYRAVIGTNVEYAEAVEFGRGPVTPTDAEALRFTVDGEVVFAQRVGPAEAQPYLEPALDASRQYITDRLQQAFARAKRRAR